jgi:hypothetical protein
VSKDNVSRRIAAERGSPLDLGVFFNDRRVRSRQLADAAPEDVTTQGELPSLPARLARSTLTWGERTDTPADKVFLYLNDTPDTLCYELWADTHFVSPADMAALMRRIEATLVGAAFGDTALVGDTGEGGSIAVPAMDAAR